MLEAHVLRGSFNSVARREPRPFPRAIRATLAHQDAVFSPGSATTSATVGQSTRSSRLYVVSGLSQRHGGTIVPTGMPRPHADGV